MERYPFSTRHFAERHEREEAGKKEGESEIRGRKRRTLVRLRGGGTRMAGSGERGETALHGKRGERDKPPESESTDADEKSKERENIF
jgi:hypothetical protein